MDEDDEEVTTTADILKKLPEPRRDNHWAKGALKRGFYSAVQGFHAANLSIIMLAPGTARKCGFEALTGGQDKLTERISNLEQKIESYDIEPVEPSYLKSGTSFLLFNTSYLLPVISVGLAASFLTGPFTSILIAGMANAHAQMGEALVHTARRRTDGITEKSVMDEAMEKDSFTRAAKINSFFMGSVCLGITLAAGPLARLLGGFTSGALTSLSRTPVGGFLTDKLVSAAHKNAITSIRKPLGKLFSKAANEGPPYISAKTSAAMAFARAATTTLMNRYIRQENEQEQQPAAEQDNDPQQIVTNDNGKSAGEPEKGADQESRHLGGPSAPGL